MYIWILHYRTCPQFSALEFSQDLRKVVNINTSFCELSARECAVCVVCNRRLGVANQRRDRRHRRQRQMWRRLQVEETMQRREQNGDCCLETVDRTNQLL